MPRQAKKLTEARIRSEARPKDRPFKLFDTESGLYLLVRPSGARYWRLRVTKDGKEQHVAIGVFPAVSRDEAVARAAAVRQVAKSGGDAAVAAAQRRGGKLPRRVTVSGDAFQSIAERWMARQEHSARTTQIRNTRVVEY